MTLLDIRNQLIGHFCEKNVLYAKDISSFSVEAPYRQDQPALIKTVLDDLCTAGIIRHVKDGDECRGFWILSQPIGTSGQEIGLSFPTCTRIASVLNAFIQAQNAAEGDEDEPGDVIDALDLNEGHIIALLEVINHLRASDTEKE